MLNSRLNIFGGWKKLEELKVIYTDAATNKLATIHLFIMRRRSGAEGSLQNDTSGKTGERASNREQEQFVELKKLFIDEEGSYKAPHGTIVGIDEGRSRNHYRIDQQENHRTRHNIQYQVIFDNNLWC